MTQLMLVGSQELKFLPLTKSAKEEVSIKVIMGVLPKRILKG